ncbi:MAG: signal recognition particle protein Srp54 [Candidatus Methanomethylicia archaeon]|nr:signal recognition particle protein Srp54 [Candidatus Methanomethylicia archaeon]MCX8169251.1 signal recognition particle protein Srp54 [Candidatus Methanomethylicia archaeon]MDW7988967.1 signal recognition particle protein Srp54 [Nitrososphaerota archaeon]
MVLESLSKALGDAIRKIIKAPIVDEKTLKEFIRDIQRALLQADVNVNLVLQISQNIEKRIKEEKLPPGFSKRELLLKILYDEMIKLLGGNITEIATLPTKRPYVIMLVGIQGSGKTTSAAKLAWYYKKRNLKVSLVCADTYRPGAYAQLKQLGEKIGVEVYWEDASNSIAIAVNGVKKLAKEGYDIIIIDTAGRHKEEKSLINEMREIAEKVKPNEIMMIIDATIGQQALIQAKAFHEATNIGSIFLTKLDGSARGGGALSAVAATGATIKFIGVGEKIEEIETFNPRNFVGRILGLGDIESLIEKFEVVEYKPKEEDVERILSGKLTFNDLLIQFKSISSMGPLHKLIQLIPGLSLNLPEEALELSKDKIKKYIAIIESMTKEERDNPEIIDRSRIRRIAFGSGTSIQDVEELLNQYKNMKKIMKTLKRKTKMLDLLKGFKGFKT